MTDIMLPILAMGGMSFLFALGLVLAHKRFQVYIDPRIERVAEALPQANCGACGFAGCQAMAEAMVGGKASATACPVAGEEMSRRIAEILGIVAGNIVVKVARVHCGGTWTAARSRGSYRGIPTCRAAQLIGGNKECIHGCLGLADCVRACPFDAMEMGEDGLPIVREDLCTACGKCVEACPRNIMELHPASDKVLVFCRSRDRGPVARKLCDRACIACGICARLFPDAIKIIDNLAVIVDDAKIEEERIDELAKCPTDSIGRPRRVR